MAYFRLRKALVKPKTPVVTFMPVTRVMTLARLLLDKWGSQDATDRLDCFVYCCMMYDSYATEYKIQFGVPQWSQRRSWMELASLQPFQDEYNAMLVRTYHSQRVGKLLVDLPIRSNDPFRPNAVAPNAFRNSPGQHAIQDLTCQDFIEAAYMVRCNLLHGSYDIMDDDTARLILTVASPFTLLNVWLARNTTW